MTVLTITIKKKKALKTLEELKANDLIDYNTKKKIRKDSIQTHVASERSLAKNWLSEKEDKAWKDL